MKIIKESKKIRSALVQITLLLESMFPKGSFDSEFKNRQPVKSFYFIYLVVFTALTENFTWTIHCSDHRRG